MTLATFGVLVLLVSGLMGVSQEKPAASRVTFYGKETLREAVAALSKTGNLIADPGIDRPAFQLTPGMRDFWPAVDELCRLARLQAVVKNGRVELTSADGQPGPRFVVYDGPFRAVISRRTVTAHDDPGMGLDRLTFQVELTCEPRMHPLVLQVPGNGLSWSWAGTSGTSTARAGRVSYGFDGQLVRSFEVRLPRPERNVKQVDQLTIQGQAWVSARRLEFELPLQGDKAITKDATTLHVHRVDVDAGSRTWEVAASLSYPEGSMEWESHQAGLIGNLKMTLHHKDQVMTSVGWDVSTDKARRLEIVWLFRNVPGQPEAWTAKVLAPSAPVNIPLKLEFKNVELP
jgi:hypothetical protein